MTHPRIFAVPAALLLPAAAFAQGGAYALYCSGAVTDQANPGTCIEASTIPTLGTLLPLGPELFVSPAGHVGISNLAPEHPLDVAGDLRADARVAIGNDATFGLVGSYDKVFDFSHTITDFTSTPWWDPFASFITIDPSHDLTSGEIFSHDLITSVPETNNRDISILNGPYLAAWYDGSGHIGALSGGLIGAESGGGVVDWQSGATILSVGKLDSVIAENIGCHIFSGHGGPNGSVGDDYSLIVRRPYDGTAITNHYGIYVEDQVVALQDNYALYVESGDTYLGGNLGVGTDTPTVALDVAGDFAASGTKSFVQAHPTDPSKEIRFVCLEGNEAGTYFRGRAELRNGRATIEVPEDFRLVTEAEGLTVQLTPMAPRADLWLASFDLDTIEVRGAVDGEFCYLVNGVRQGYAGFETVRARAEKVSTASERRVERPAPDRSMLEGRERMTARGPARAQR